MANPTLGAYARPKTPGVDPGLAAISSLLPAIGPLLGGTAGTLAAPLLGIPGQYLAYQNSYDQAAVDQENKQAVIDMLEGLPTQYIPKPNYPSVTPSYLRQGLQEVNSSRAQTARAADDMLAQAGNSRGGVSPSVYDSVERFRADREMDSQNSLAALLEKAHNAKIANDMTIAGMETARAQANEAAPWQKASALANAIMGYPWEVANNTGFLNAVTQASSQARQERFQQEQLAFQKHQATQANELGWATMGMSTLGQLGGAGITAYGLSNIGSSAPAAAAATAYTPRMLTYENPMTSVSPYNPVFPSSGTPAYGSWTNNGWNGV